MRETSPDGRSAGPGPPRTLEPGRAPVRPTRHHQHHPHHAHHPRRPSS
ncbi:hypothetical protein KCH_24710 [Kitasatospora cheerisanensis KCTC 2395]|uniref:Uncharacterized protein n=1 Tax=Kitasatospora cheerisanensis KCTC 2395 TaxID=1348663 RepID=A0A066YW92_9ACTN|nr:hypothetical protein KCH_24710 [Kitasatospora cheerisanensis KCTC 2395]